MALHTNLKDFFIFCTSLTCWSDQLSAAQSRHTVYSLSDIFATACRGIWRGWPDRRIFALPLVRVFEIRIAMEPVFVIPQQTAGFFVAHAAFANGFFHAAAQLGD